MINQYSAVIECSISKQKPLVLAIRLLMTATVVVSSGVSVAEVNLHLPNMSAAPANLTSAPVSVNAQGSVMTIDQKHSANKVTLDWQNFNIDKGYAVNFAQNANQIALNNIHDANASQILGSLTAGGQVYLINQNGFLFGKDSQVNVNSLVASTLGISDANLQLGITNVFDSNKYKSDFQNGAAALSGKAQIYLKDSLGNVLLDSANNPIKIQIFVENGAKINTNAPGGLVILAAPSVTNAGDINTPDGQAILVASKDKVYLQEVSTDSAIRGMLVEVGTGGDVNNLGKVIADRGNASLLGFAVNQQGTVTASTSVLLNGSVRLLAREGLLDPHSSNGVLTGSSSQRLDGSNATVTLFNNSLTSVDLDGDKTTTAIDPQPQPKSDIQLSGHKIVLKTGATVQARSGNVTVNAIDDVLGKNTARIYLEQGSQIDVSGLKNVEIPVQQNSVELKLQSNELRDSPLQRTGVLYGQTVAVDLSETNLKYSSAGFITSATIPIADISGGVARITRNIDQRSTTAGIIALNSTGDVVTQAGSVVNVSGGSVLYQGGMVNTTQLVSKGQLFNIETADPNRYYDNVITTRYYKPGFVEGKTGGLVNISAYQAVLDGNLQGKTIIGDVQRAVGSSPAGSSLAINLNDLGVYSGQSVVFNKEALLTNLSPDDSIPTISKASAVSAALHLNSDFLNSSGISNLKIATTGSITVDKNALLALPALGKLNWSATNFDIQGQIIDPSGSVNLNAISVGGALPSSITVGSSGLIDVSGIWVNDALDFRLGNNLSPININGGNVTLITEQKDLTLEKGSRIDVSGGAWQSISKLTAGKGGAITLASASSDPLFQPGNLSINGSLSAWSLKNGGSLTLKANKVIIGADHSTIAHSSANLFPLVLDPRFFHQGGFSSYNISSNLYGLKVADNVTLALTQVNRQLTDAAFNAATGSHLSQVSDAIVLPDAIRLPTNLSLSYSESSGQNTQEALTIGYDSKILGDAQATITLNSDTSIFVDGSIEAPTGNIILNINAPYSPAGYFAAQGIWLGAESQLLAQGVYSKLVSPNGLQTGNVLAGGSVSINANRGYIVSRAGSLIDVSGNSAELDFFDTSTTSSNFQKVNKQISSAGGKISLTSGEGMLLDGTLKAKTGGGSAEGGALSVVLNRQFRQKPDYTQTNTLLFPDDVNTMETFTIDVTSNICNVVPVDLNRGTAISSDQFSGKALLKSSSINAGGFDSLILQTDAVTVNNQYTSGTIFNGDVTLNTGQKIVLDTPSIQSTGGIVQFNAPYIALGSSQSLDNQQTAPDAMPGNGKLSVNGQAIDLVGGLALNGFTHVNLNSASDLRLNGLINTTNKTDLGRLNVASDLTITAQQVYPSTLTNFNINVSGTSNETVTIHNSVGNATPVLTAGGALSITAPNIIQDGTIKAPFGAINLNADKLLQLSPSSLTSVSGNGLTIPFGQVSGRSTWIYPLDGTGQSNLVEVTPPGKSIQLTAKNLVLQSTATIDLSGGGDLFANEFIPGAGGSNDVLGNSNGFAVLPNFNPTLTPNDPFLSSTSSITNSQAVYLGGSTGLAAGWYTMLPAQYALLPGAYLVTPQSGSQDQFQTTYNLAGTTIVSGRYGVAGTHIEDARTQGFAVELGRNVAATSSNVAKAQSQYNVYYASQFFAAQSTSQGKALPQLPQDAGSLALGGLNSLTLEATLLANPVAKGLGGQVDISANSLEVVSQSSDLANLAAGTVGLLASDLNKLNSPSLLLGGKRSKENQGQRVTVTTQDLKVDQNVDLKGQEILLAATNNLLIGSGAVIQSSGQSAVNVGNLLLSNSNATSDAALLRVSAANQVNVIRDQPLKGVGGVLTVETGAMLKAEGSMLLDSSKDTVFSGLIDMNKGSLALNSSAISLGKAPINRAGLVLQNINFNVDELRLTSASDINIYGGLNINTKQLFLSAASINGFDNAGQTATMSANLINISNQNAQSQVTGNGTGALVLEAPTIQLGSGQYAINGFNQVALMATDKATGNILGSIGGIGQVFDSVSGNSSIAASSVLTVAGDLTMAASFFGGSNGATTRIDATGHQLNLNSSTAVDPNRNKGLGVSWSLLADSITSNARFDLLSGKLALKALNGDLNLNNGSAIDLSGQVVAFGNTYKASSAGTLSLTADQGNINFATGAAVNLAGTRINGQQVSDAGTVSLMASQGSFAWNGVLDALGSTTISNGFKQGNFQLDVNSLGLASNAFSTLNSQLASSGFTESVTLEQHRADVVIAATDKVKAQNFTLAVDQGSVLVSGRIDATGVKAGNISIYARNGISIGSVGALYAKATGTGNAGGTILLDTVHRDDFGTGLLDLSAVGGFVDVSSGLGGAGGFVHLRTGAGSGNGLNTVAVTDINTRIVGSDPLKTVLEATSIVTPADGTQIFIDDIIAWESAATTYMTASPMLNNNSGANLALLPGLEVRSTSEDGSLTLQDKWDFMDGSLVGTSSWQSNWRYANASGAQVLPGFLTLRATGDVNFNATLTDAFANTPLTGQAPDAIYQDVLQPGQSWSYNIIAGNNINLSPFNPSDGSQVMIRTGTGNIQFATGESISFVQDPNNASSAAAVYTMGTPASYTLGQLLAGTVPGAPDRLTNEADQQYLNRLSSSNINGLNSQLRYGYFDETQVGSNYLYAEYPTQGGNIDLSAKGNIVGIQTGQQIADWLVRAGFWNQGRADNSPTAWGIDVSGDANQVGLTSFNGRLDHIRYFNQNVGALGGGNVQIQVGGNVQNLSVMLPTTSKPFGSFNDLGQWVTNGTVVNGGGDLQITAGQDIIGGEYYVGLGSGKLVAGGSIASSPVWSDSTLSAGVLLEVGNANFTLQARQDVNVLTAMNPTITNQNVLPQGSQYDTEFFTYGANSAVNLLSVAGDVLLTNDPSAIATLKNINTTSGSPFEYEVYPGTLNATALSGDIRIDNPMTLFPQAKGNLALLANNNIGSDAVDGSFYINMSDTDYALLPSALTPVTQINGSFADYLTRELLSPGSSNSSKLHASIPVHQGDASLAMIEAKNGNIAFPSQLLATFYLPKASEFIAGKDITNISLLAQNLSVNDVTTIHAGQNISFDTNFNANGNIDTTISSEQFFKLGGQGQLNVISGNSINLGGSDGIQTIGNLLNPALSQVGASVNVMAGLTNQPNYLGFINKYQNVYPAELIGLVGLNEEQQQKQAAKIFSVLFQEITASASTASLAPQNERAASYQRGTDAVQALFPANKMYSGDLSLVFSQIKTLEGGDLNLLVPGGNIDVGLAGVSGVSKAADQLGIVVQQTGDINILTTKDVSVNQSRLFTMGGGNIVAWSALGNIDAGKGAKSVLSAPRPVTTIDTNGNISTIFPPVFSGSGIQAIGGGNVTLVAPAGVVDAGEAGISGGHVTIAATAVIGAANISSTNGTSGVPTIVSVPVSMSGANSVAASAAKNATQNAEDNNQNNNSLDGKTKEKVSIISADIVGFGDCSVSDVKEGKNGCGA